MGKIYGVGVGPGNKEHLTLKAVEVLKNADYIFVPHNKGKNMALDAVIDFIDQEKIRYLDYPMKEMTAEEYLSNAEIISNLLIGNKIGAFITIGDPMFYSTVINTFPLLDASIEVEYVPGIPSFVYGASASKQPLALKGESLMVMDHVPDKFMEGVDNYAILKTSNLNEEVLDFIEANGFSYAYVEKGSLPDEILLVDREEILTRKAYMSFILLRRNKQ